MDKRAKDLEVANDNWQAFDRAHGAGHDARLRDWVRHNNFYLGDQWEADIREKLERERRPVLTINEVLRTTNAVLGNHSENRVDVRYRPRNDGNSETAEILTSVTDHIFEANRYHEQESQCFADGVIMDVGYLDVRMNFDTSALGDVEITSLDPGDVIIDPDAKEYDPDTWTEVFVARWHTLNEIESLYGKDKRKELEGFVMAGETYGSGSVRFRNEVTFGNSSTPAPQGPDAVKNFRGVRVIERQWRKLAPRKMFVDIETGDTRPVPESWDDERIKDVAERFGLAVRNKVASRIRWTVSCDHVLLHDDWSLYEHFTVVPFFPLFRRGQFSGLVRQLISPQEQLNKVESQQLHVVNTTANSGWLVEEGSLANMTPEELEERGAETGLVINYRRGRTPPAKILPNQIPSGLDRLGQKASQYIFDISGAEALLGRQPKSQVSGVALEHSMGRALVTLQPMMDNLAKTRDMVARRVLKLVQAHYTETRVLRVTDWRDPQEPEREVVINQPDELGDILNDVTVGHYDVVVGTAPMRNGAMEHEFAEAVQLRKDAGVMIPDDVIIRASHLTNKYEVAERVMRLQGMGEPDSEEAQLIRMQQELAMQEAQMRVAEIEAKVGKLQAEAMLMQSKAQATGTDAEMKPQTTQLELQLQLERLQFEIAKAKAEMETKIRLAEINTGSRNAQSVLKAMAERIKNEQKLETQERIAALHVPTEPQRKR